MANVTRQIRVGLLVLPGAIVLQLTAFFLIARYLGPGTFGVYSLIFAIMTVFMLITEMGVGTIIMKSVAEGRRAARDCIAVAWPGIALVALIAAVIQAAIVFSFYPPRDAGVAVLMACLNVAIFGLSMVLSCSLRGLGRIEQWYVGFSCQKLLALLLVVGVLIPADLGLGFAMAVWPISSAVVLLYYVRCLWGNTWRGELRWSPAELRELVAAAVPVGLTTAVYRISAEVEIFILAALVGAEAVGIYAIGQRLLNPAGSILRGAIIMPTFPELCRLAQSDHPTLGQRVADLEVVHWLAAMGIAVSAWLLAPYVIPALLDTAFNDSVWVVQITIWALAPFLISLQMRFVYVALSEQKRYLRIVLVYLAAKLVVIAFLTYLYGLMGACIGMVCCEALLAAAVRAKVPLENPPRLSGMVIVVTIATALLVLVSLQLGAVHWVSLVLTGTYVCASLWLFNKLVRGVRERAPPAGDGSPLPAVD